MRLTGLLAGREAMISEGAALATVADNISNLNTTGFKSGRTEFSNILAASEGSLYGNSDDPGNGSEVQNVQVRHDKQGTFDFTDRSLDLAIDGNGLFVVSDGTSQFYTRAGNFQVDKDGNFVTEDGKQVMGFTTASPTTPVALTVTGVSGQATATSTVSLAGNLDSSTAVRALPAATSFTTLSQGADFVSPITVIDSLGAQHDISLYFFHDTAPLGFTIQAYVDGGEVTGGTAGTPSLVGTGTVNFQATGTQATGAAATMTLNGTWLNGATPTAATVDLSGLTGFASKSNLSKVTLDGNRAGTPIGYQVDEDGSFNVTLDNGDNIRVGQVALATFPSIQGLERAGDNYFRAGDTAGTPTIGAPGSAGHGDIVGGALEGSNVDPASEFVDLVRYQRAYQAGSQVVTTMSELLSTTLQLA